MPRLTGWLTAPESERPGLFDLNISYVVLLFIPIYSHCWSRLKHRPFWEFQFTGLRDIPLFDENFPYRVDNNLELVSALFIHQFSLKFGWLNGVNNWFQRWEVCRAGYRLLPIEDLFVYHTLSKDDKGKDSNKRKDAIKRKNYGRYDKF